MAMLSPDMCSQLETSTAGDQLEAVRREHNHAPKVKGKRQVVPRADQRENVSRTSINMVCTMISEYFDAIGHLIEL